MSRCLWRHGAVVLLGGLGLIVPVPTAGSQAPGTVTGTVRDSAGHAITGAEVGVVGSATRTRTRDDGVFRLDAVPPGSVKLHARRIGFRVDTQVVVLSASGSAEVDFILAGVTTILDPVVVNSRRKRQTGRLAGFYERMQSGLHGYFLTREDIERGDPRQLTNVLQRVPGVEIYRGRVRLRGKFCAPLLWLDGVAMPAGEVDMNSFSPLSLEGIEIYLTASGAPIRYQHTVDRARCGTILLWSRGADTELRRRPTRVSAAEIERRHRTRQAWTADEVDVTARLEDDLDLQVAYPAELFAEQVTGSVLLEAVVDSSGRATEDSFGVIFSSHPLFARAAQDALKAAQFRPAQRQGRSVPQIVQIPFQFDPRAGQRRAEPR